MLSQPPCIRMTLHHKVIFVRLAFHHEAECAASFRTAPRSLVLLIEMYRK
jgi:hypothetical protein